MTSGGGDHEMTAMDSARPSHHDDVVDLNDIEIVDSAPVSADVMRDVMRDVTRDRV